jgi:hypothetical protein
MIPLILSSLLIAGGSSFLGNLQLPSAEPITNHTLLGEKIPATKVVCRDRWGTPMLPDGKAGYSLIAPTNAALIAQSLWIPPASGTRPERPVPSAPVVPTEKPLSSAPVVPAEKPLPSKAALPSGGSAIMIPGSAVLK